MGNMVLKSVRIINFRSFKEEVRFETEIDYSKKEHIHSNTFKIKDNSYNKVSYIFGANGAGKSNFCKAIKQIQSIILLTPLLISEHTDILESKQIQSRLKELENYFKLEQGYENIPISISIELILEEISYQYSFKILNRKIVEEKLYKKNKRTELILSRTSPRYEDIELKSELVNFKRNITFVKENVLCLPILEFFGCDLAHKIIEAINKIKIVNMANFKFPRAINENRYTRDKVNQYLKVLKLQDPTMKDIKVEFIEDDEIEDENSVVFSEEQYLGNKRVKFKAIHNLYKNGEVVGEVELPILKTQSSKIVKLLGVLPLIFDTLNEGGVLIIDEIESGMHTNLIKSIINLFYNSEENKLNVQLICTSQNSVLVEKGIRRDQVWFIEKGLFGESILSRLSDKKVRPSENYSQKYLQGAFGAVPKDLLSDG